MSHTLWLLGYPDQARLRSREALAQELSHPFSMAVAQAYGAMLHQFRREPPATHQRAKAAMTLCAEQGFAYYLAWARIMQGWARGAQGAYTDGIPQIQQGLADLRATGGRARLTYYLTLLAEAHGADGQAEQGLRLLTEAHTEAGQTEECFWQAEFHRLTGTLLWRSDPAHHAAAAEACFFQAIDVARGQHTKALETRAATSLSRLWQQQGKSQEAYALLAPVYAWFTEGFDTADVQDAKALLNALADCP